LFQLLWWNSRWERYRSWCDWSDELPEIFGLIPCIYSWWCSVRLFPIYCHDFRVWLQTGYGLIIGFIDHLCTPLGTTLYNSVTDRD
jgi:hypothetical protein